MLKINVQVEKKVGKEYAVVAAPVENWGIRCVEADIKLLTCLAGVPYDKKELQPFTIVKTVKELMQAEVWNQETKYAGTVPAWYYIHYVTELLPYGRTLSSYRITGCKDLDTPQEKQVIYEKQGPGKDKTIEALILPEAEFMQRFRTRKQETKNYDSKYWISLMKKDAKWSRIFVWLNWEVKLNQFVPYKDFWANTLCYMAKAAGNLEFSKLRVTITVTNEEAVQEPAEEAMAA